MDEKESKIDEVLGRALRDSDFRAKLTSDPAAAGAECGLTVEEVEMIAGGLAIGDSLLNPETVAWCTNKTCNEKGGILIRRPDVVRRPGDRIIKQPQPKPGVVKQEKTETEKV
jgi:hypothetical protein